MTKMQREKLLELPDTEDEVVRHHSLTADDLAAIAQSRMPETRLGYALQLCCLRYPGRYLRRGEFLPGAMLDHIAEQVGADAEAISLFARRGATRYEQLAAIKQRHGFRDFTRPTRAELAAWAERQAVGLTDGRVLLDRLIERMRAQQIIIPGVSVVERTAAAAMHAADAAVVAETNSLLSDAQRLQLDALLSDKMHVRQSRLSWLREPPSRVGGRPLLELLDKLTLVRTIGGDVVVSRPGLEPRMVQMAKEGRLYTAQAFQQMGPARRHTIMMATLSELGITLTDGALTMFQSLVGRANLRARKRLEETIAASAEQGRTRLTRIADVLDAFGRHRDRGARRRRSRRRHHSVYNSPRKAGRARRAFSRTPCVQTDRRPTPGKLHIRGASGVSAIAFSGHHSARPWRRLAQVIAGEFAARTYRKTLVSTCLQGRFG